MSDEARSPNGIASWREAGDFIYQWPSRLVISLGSLHESKGDIHAIISIYVRDASGSPRSVIAPSRLNLMATRSRLDLAKTLDARRVSEGLSAADWLSMIEEAVNRTYRQWQRGEPFVDLSEVNPPPASLRYLLPPFVIEGEPVAFVADGGSGKSTLMAAIALSLMSGRAIVGGIEPSRRVSVLYCDWESNEDEVTRRLQSLARAAGIDRSPIMYRSFYRPLCDEIATVEREIARHGHEVIIIDSVAPASGGTINDTEAARDLYGALRRLKGVAKLLPAHVNKEDARNRQSRGRIIGNIMYENLSRSVWEIMASEESAEGSLSLGLYQRKHNGGARSKPLGLTIRYDDEGQPAAIARGDLEDYGDLSAKLPVMDRLVSVLREGPLDTNELAERLGISRQAAVLRAKRNKQVEQHGGGRGTGNVAQWSLRTAREPW